VAFASVAGDRRYEVDGTITWMAGLKALES
jgi:hypothetical protein